MVGNSLRSDILPVVDIGGTAVHIPAALTWSHEHADPSSSCDSDITNAKSLEEFPAFVEEPWARREHCCTQPESGTGHAAAPQNGPLRGCEDVRTRP